MTRTLSVKPGPGLKVKRPQSEGGTYLEEGKYTDVPNTEFWRRRKDAGDVVVQPVDEEEETPEETLDEEAPQPEDEE